MKKIAVFIGIILAICLIAPLGLFSQPSIGGQFIRKWLALGPIVEGKTAAEAIAIDYLREATGIEESKFATLEGAPKAGDSIIITPEGYATQVRLWTVLQLLEDRDVNRMLVEEGEVDNAVAYLLTFVTSEQAGQRELQVESDDVARAWLNGELVNEGQTIVNFKKGVNVLMVKVANTVRYWILSVRFADDSGLKFFDAPVGKRLSWLSTYQKYERTVLKEELWKTYRHKDGLADKVVTAIHQDREGNMWFGTPEGVSRFDGREWITYTTEDGLADNEVRTICQDNEGNMWFGTFRGVSRFDGKKWITYTTKDGMVNDHVRAVYHDREGNMWFGTFEGVSRFDGREWTTYTENDGLAHNYVWAIHQDFQGNMWFGTWGGGVSRFDGKEWTTYTTKDGLAEGAVIAVHRDREDNMWFGTRGGGVSRFDRKEWTTYTQKDGLAYNYVWAICQDSEGNMWFGTYNGGVSRFDGEKWTNYTKKDGLADDFVFAIHQDREGNMWFGTLEGVSRLDTKEWTAYTIKEALADNYVFAVHQDREGNMWFGTDSGVSRFDGEKWTTYTTKEGLANNWVYAIHQDNEGNMWFGTNSGASRFDGKEWTAYTTKEGLADSFVLAIHQDRGGNMWFGTGGGVSRFDGKEWTTYTTKEGLANNWVYAIHQDNEGDMWFGTYGGVSRFNGKECINYTTEDGLAHNYVWAIHKDDEGNMWFGTRGGGVSRFDGKKWTIYNQKDGLANNWVYAIDQDPEGNLWFGTYKRVSRYSGVPGFDGNYFQSIDFEEELVSGIVASIRADKDGNIWLGTNDGVTRYTPSKLPPLIRVTQMIADKPYENPKGSIRLSDYVQHISFTFRGISFRRSEGMKYQYQLVGRDANWQGPTSKETVEYLDLRPGRYIFKVQAISRDLIYSDPPASLNVTIPHSSFYKSGLFIISLGVGVFLILTGVCSIILTLHSRKVKMEFEPIPNPYIAGGPVRSEEMFFGREEDFTFVKNKLKTEKEGIIIVFYGQRRSGKTSILHQILNSRLGEEFMPVMIDMQEMAVNSDAEFYEKIAEEVSFGLSKWFDVNYTEYKFRTEGVNPALVFERFIDDIMEKLDDKRLVLMFDEYELLEEKMDEGILSGDTPTFFAGILERYSRISFIFTGSRAIAERNPQYWHTLFGKSTARRISLLSVQDTLRLIKEPVGDVVKYQRDVPPRIYRLTGGQPFYTQYVCQLLIERLNQLKRYKVYADDVEQTARELSDNSPPQMMYFWNELDSKEKLALVLLERVLESSDSYASASMVEKYAASREEDINLEEKEVARILDGLCEYELLQRERVSEETYEYRYKIDLFRYWVRRHQSIANVISNYDSNSCHLERSERSLSDLR